MYAPLYIVVYFLLKKCGQIVICTCFLEVNMIPCNHRKARWQHRTGRSNRIEYQPTRWTVLAVRYIWGIVYLDNHTKHTDSLCKPVLCTGVPHEYDRGIVYPLTCKNKHALVGLARYKLSPGRAVTTMQNQGVYYISKQRGGGRSSWGWYVCGVYTAQWIDVAKTVLFGRDN